MPDAPPTLTNPAKRKKGGCRGCLKIFLIVLAVLLVIFGIIAALFYRIPQRLGLMPNKAEKLLVATPDREAADELLAEARARGMSTQGVSLYVLPYKDGNGSVASAIFDSREGFSFSQGGRLNPVGQAFSQIAGGPVAEKLNIERITVTYISAKGEDLMSLSAKRSDSLAFANGSMSEEQFMSVLGGDINLPAVVNEQIDSINRMLE
jgi:hypothetical protein